jgi:hypothetical protein
MKYLSKYTKNRIIKLWLCGCWYDEIAANTGVDREKVKDFIERERMKKPTPVNLHP